MKDVLMIVVVLGIFVLGYFLMARLDQFLDENRRAIEQENETEEPTCVVLTEELSDEEIAEEIRRFRSKHNKIRIVLCDSSDTESSERMKYRA